MLQVRELRLKLGLSQAALARRARLHPSDISRVETGHAVLYPKQRRRLARALGVSETEIQQEATAGTR